MQGIGDFLKKYLDFTPPARVKARAIAKAISEQFKVVVGEEEVETRGTRAFIRGTASLKSEIALNKKSILLRAKELGAGDIVELS